MIVLGLISLNKGLFAHDIKLGTVVEVSSSAYKGLGSDLTFLPVLDYDNDQIYIDGAEAGAYFYQSKQHELSVIVNYHNVGFRPKDSSDSRMKKLDRRYETVMAGLNYTYMGNWGAMDAQVMTDVLNKNNGIIVDIGYIAFLQKEPFIFAPKIGLIWQNAHYTNYYYGVTKEESAQSSFNPYSSKQSINPYIELNMNYQMSPKFDLFLSGKYEFLNKQIKNSPIVDRKNTASIQLGFKYQIL